MPIYRTGDLVNFALKLQVVKIFGYQDNIYYIVEVLQDKVPWAKGNKMYGALDFNGNATIPKVVRHKADALIQELRNQNLE